MSFLKSFGDIILWPGSKLCDYFGVEQKSDMGLMRSFFNFLIWLPLGLLFALYVSLN